MSCCPTPPEIKVGSSSDEESSNIQDTDILPGESVECYMRRAGDVTDRLDDKTEPVPGKIENTDIPLKNGVSVNVTFQLTANSPVPATSWSISGTPLPSGVTFSDNKLVGTFPESSYEKPFKVVVTAKGADGDIDSRSFVFSPSKATGSNEISFVHPLPGARVTSPFGPRVAPTAGASARHGGADFSVKPLPPADVLAAADGEVTFTGFQGKAGNYIKIRHPNAAGRELCTTVYMHLASIYVSTGQKVVAGQKIGKEGNTGVGTGPHLHFECRLPNGTKIDPVPLIKGTVTVARLTNPDNTGDFDTVKPNVSDQNAALTPANVDAKQNGCEPFGPDYPKDPNAPNEEPPNDIGDPFEKAWFYTMKHEVGPHWNQSFPSDPEVKQGLIATKPQRRKVGYVEAQGDTGGKTKFGISQNNNPQVSVPAIDYESAKKVGYNNYWKQAKCDVIVKTKPKTAILLFDITFLCGQGGARKIQSESNMNGDDVSTVDSLGKAWEARLRELGAKKKKEFLEGWLARVRESVSNAKSFSPKE